jgi:hypothetical protein
MITFLLWLLLLVLCWPVALLALLLYPLVWLLLLPLRLVGIAVEGVFALLRALILLPARVLGERRNARADFQSDSALRSRRSAARPRSS